MLLLTFRIFFWLSDGSWLTRGAFFSLSLVFSLRTIFTWGCIWVSRFSISTTSWSAGLFTCLISLIKIFLRSFRLIFCSCLRSSTSSVLFLAFNFSVRFLICHLWARQTTASTIFISVLVSSSWWFIFTGWCLTFKSLTVSLYFTLLNWGLVSNIFGIKCLLA